MSGYTGLAARVLRLLRAPHHLRAMNRTFGALFVAAGALLASFRRAAWNASPGARPAGSRRNRASCSRRTRTACLVAS